MMRFFLPLALLWGAALHSQEPLRLKVAAVQFRSSFDVVDNGARIVDALQRLARDGVQVAAFPECALTGYHTRPVMEASSEAVAAAEGKIRQTCRDHKIAAVVG